MLDKTTCFDVFEQCVLAVQAGELIESISAKDKEFHFQNWFEKRLRSLSMHFEGSGRNTYPDFCLVERAEGYEIKGLAWPGRERDYDSNSQVPTGYHNGRQIFYVFGRYPADLSGYADQGSGRRQYPVVDLVLCHGDFLNADHNYVHKNKSVKGFGTYGDIMIRDRKMYVAPTPFALTEGTTGLLTLILPENFGHDDRYQVVGNLTRIEAETLVVGYNFDLRTNELVAQRVPNPNAGTRHKFVAYRLKGQSGKLVSMPSILVLPNENGQPEEE
ncbi:hypothetical protein [Xanthomonas translucens]|uniref:hypothetical protein n=1 Tax=Xanthomonas campestris pv. translucens TaxID=343 RepID=UPI0009BB7A4B|nr:hypothetical protein [Xanthomonas translucens]MCT8271656.1 hypothetical protein [Xanthomonas translucens pv. undulosa]WNJ32444.1 hypothetical protein RMA82_08850 [Xanthomonas translucens pv. undulosa]